MHPYGHGYEPSRQETDQVRATIQLMGKPAIRVSEAEAANDLPSLLARVRAGAEVVNR